MVSKMELMSIGKKVIFTANKYMPKALVGMSAGLTAGGLVLAIKAGMEFQKLRDEEEEITWKDYARIFAPCIAAGVFAIACAFAGLSESEKRTAAAAALASMYESNQKEIDAKARELFGDGKTEKLYDEVAKEQLKKAPEPMVAYGGTAFFDILTGQWIYLDIETIRHKVNCMNDRINDGYSVTKAEWCDAFDLYSTPADEMVGWNSKLTGIIKFRPVWMEDARGRTVAAIQLEVNREPKLFYESEEDEEIDEYYRQRNPGWSEV